jgi:hypothetical protein
LGHIGELGEDPLDLFGVLNMEKVSIETDHESLSAE